MTIFPYEEPTPRHLPGDEFAVFSVAKGLAVRFVMVKLTPEARLAWRLSGVPPTLTRQTDKQISSVVQVMGSLASLEDREAFWHRLAQLNGRAP